MSDIRQTDNIPAVDQVVRAEEQAPATEEDVIAAMKRQLAELEARDRDREQEVQRQKEQAGNERRAREAAEARAQAAEARAQAEAQSGRHTAEDAQIDALTAGIEAHKGKLVSLKAQYSAAFAEGAGDRMADIQADMALAAADLRQLESGKTALEARKQARANGPQPQPGGREADYGPQTETERRESYIRQQPTLVQSWLRHNADRYFTDPALQQDIAAAARIAQRRNIPVESQEYIDFIEQSVGMQSAPSPQAPSPPSHTGPGQRMTAAAPAGGAAAPAGGTSDVYLTPEERALIKSGTFGAGMTEAKYAKEKAILLKEGLIGPGAR